MYSFTHFISSPRTLARFAKSAGLPLAAALLCAYPAMAQCTNGNFGSTNDIRVYGDFDGDGRLDYAFFRPSNGCWYVRFFSQPNTLETLQFGLPGDIPVPADYDGAGFNNYAVWRPSTGTWWILSNTSRGIYSVQFGLPGDIPVTGVYDVAKCTSPGVPAGCLTNPKASLAVFRPSNAVWFITPNNGGAAYFKQWGLAGDVPIAGDWDGDGKQDVAVWRPSNGTFYVVPSSTPNSPLVKQWGLVGDVPVTASFDLAVKTSYAVQRPTEGNVYFQLGNDPQHPMSQRWGPPNGGPATNIVRNQYSLCDIGKNIYVRVEGDFDGDGLGDFAFWRPSDGTWYIVPSSNPHTAYALQWGLPGDIPVPADYDGDGRTDIAVWRPGNGVYYVIPDSGAAPITPVPSAAYTQQWGLPGDIPAVGDFNKDGKADFTVWRPSNGNWYMLPSVGTGGNPVLAVTQQLGLPGDIPVAGDFDGDRQTDYAVWRPASGVWYVKQSTTGTVVTQAWGQQGDLPVPADFSGHSKADFAVFRASSASWLISPNGGGASTTIQLGLTGNDVIYAQPPITTSYITPDVRQRLEGGAFLGAGELGPPPACEAQ